MYVIIKWKLEWKTYNMQKNGWCGINLHELQSPNPGKFFVQIIGRRIGHDNEKQLLSPQPIRRSYEPDYQSSTMLLHRGNSNQYLFQI